MIMKKKVRKFSFIIILFFITSTSILVLAADFENAAEPRCGETETLIIGFKEEIPDWAFEKYEVLEKNEELNCILVKARFEKEKVFRESSGLREVKYVEENKLVRALYVPNDLRWSDQYGPRSIKADDAWDYEKGNKSVKIAIVDTGIQYNHSDLAANYVSGGYDWVNNDSDPYDDNGHGTHCAGIAAAVMDNEIGIAGIAQVSLTSEKVLNKTGWGTTWDVSQGITHAANNSADVISLSLGGGYSTEMEDACNYAWGRGCVIVAASGNDGSPLILYPAAYDSVIAVGSTGLSEVLSGFSNYGAAQELVAPGEGILSTVPGGYSNKGGTSMATPHVAGVAALIKSRYPAFTNEEIRERMRNTAKDLGALGKDDDYGYGLVDAYAALGISFFDTKEGTYPSISGTHEGTIKPNQTIIVDKLYTYSCAGTGGHSEYVWIRGNGVNETATWDTLGYGGDWHTITFARSFTLQADVEYNYTIITGSYPQIIHNQTLTNEYGTLNCTRFRDANGKVYDDWIPAIRLFL
jgi:thermitase